MADRRGRVGDVDELGTAAVVAHCDDAAGVVVEPVGGAERPHRHGEGAEVRQLELGQWHDRAVGAVELLDVPRLERAGGRAVRVLVVLLGHQQDVPVGQRGGRVGPEGLRVGSEAVVVDEVVEVVHRALTSGVTRGTRVGDLDRVQRIAYVEDVRPSRPRVGGVAGVVHVPLVPAPAHGIGAEGLGPLRRRVAVHLDGTVEVGEVEDGEAAPAGHLGVVAGGVGVAAVGAVDAGHRVGAGRRRDPRPYVGRGRVGDVDHDELVVATHGIVDVLEVVGRRLVEVHPDHREAIGALARDLPLAAVHRFVLELCARHRPDLAGRRRVAHVVDRDVVEARHHKVRRRVQEAAGDACAAGTCGGEPDIGRADERCGEAGVVRLGHLLVAVAVAVGVRGSAGKDERQSQEPGGGQSCWGGEAHAGPTTHPRDRYIRGPVSSAARSRRSRGSRRAGWPRCCGRRR